LAEKNEFSSTIHRLNEAQKNVQLRFMHASKKSYKYTKKNMLIYLSTKVRMKRSYNNLQGGKSS